MPSTKNVATITPIKQIEKTLVSRKSSLAEGLKGHNIDPDKFIRVVMNAVVRDDKLMDQVNTGKIDRGSLVIAAQDAAAHGLLLNNKEAALLTFWNKDKKTNVAQYIPMVDGIVKLAHQSGEVKSITCEVVKEGDDFDYWIDEEGAHLRWRPGDERGKGIKVFAIGLTMNGGRYIQVLEAATIDAIASHSKNTAQYDQTKGKWWESWWKKAAVRRVCKLMPSIEARLENVFEADNESFDFSEPEEEEIDISQGVTVEKKTGGSKAAGKITGKNSKKKEEPKQDQDPDPDPDDAIPGDYEDVTGQDDLDIDMI
jgi:recombination protein RecT